MHQWFSTHFNPNALSGKGASFGLQHEWVDIFNVYLFVNKSVSNTTEKDDLSSSVGYNKSTKKALIRANVFYVYCY